MDLVLWIVVVAALGGIALVVRHRRTQEALRRREESLAPVRKLAFEDVTAFGEDLAKLDLEISGHVLDEGSTADYQRALDAYEAAKVAGDSMAEPDDIRNLTELIDDGRYAIACVRARVSRSPLPTRRPPCFFDPRHGPSVADVPFIPAGGVERRVPACALDTERIRAGAEPDARKVVVEGQRLPYWQAGPAYQPYALGYFGADALTWLLWGSIAFGGFGDSDYGDYGDSGESSSAAGDGGGGDGGGFDGGGGDFGL
jgi:uncharacterized membrane protein YgcG